MLLIACTKSNTVDFTWKPVTPRAGESVRFTNTSASGSEWEWSFGDIATSSSKSPYHTYRRPGEYIVKLTVDGKKGWTATHVVTVLDTVPQVAYTTDSVDVAKHIGIYHACTFYATTYNPYGHRLTYRWAIDDKSAYLPLCPSIDGGDSITGATYKVLFTRPVEALPVRLEMTESYTENGRDTTIYRHLEKVVKIVDCEAPGILWQNSEGAYRQRFFTCENVLYFEARKSVSSSLLAEVQDTVCTYNGMRYSTSALPACAPDAEGLYLTDGRCYYRTGEGLYVVSLSGANRVQLSDRAVWFMQVDRQRNRLYWSDGEGLKFMPLIQSDNNRPQPNSTVVVNEVGDIEKIGVE